MQSYDFLMLAVVIGCMVFGAWKGMAWQVASLASIGASYIGAVNFAGAIAPMIKAQPPWNNAAAMLIVYIVSSIGVWMVFRLVSGFIDSVRLREFDRQVGAAFGAAKGVLLCLVITFFAVSLSPETAGGMVRSSRAGYYMTQLLKDSDPYLPTRVREVLGPYINQLENQLNQPGTLPNAPPNGQQPFPNSPLPPQRPGAPGQPSRPAPRPFRNLLSGSSDEPAPDGSSSGAKGWRPNTNQNAGTASSQQGGVLELGSRFLRQWTGGSDPPPSQQPSGGAVDNSSYGPSSGYGSSSLPSRSDYAPPNPGYAPNAPAPNQRTNQPAPGQPAPGQPAPGQPAPSDDWNGAFSRGLDALRTLQEFGTTPSPTVPSPTVPPRQRW